MSELSVAISCSVSLDEDVIFELVQLCPESADGAVLLASFQRNVRDFLYPYPQLLPSYGSGDREVLMEKSWDFPVSFSNVDLTMSCASRSFTFKQRSINELLIIHCN